MKSSGKSLLLLLLSACCINAYISCTGEQKKVKKLRVPVVCSDTSKQHFTLDTIKGYQLKPNVDLSLLLNFYAFNNKEEFDKYFMRPPIPTDSVPPSLNFKDNWLVAIITDNKTPNVNDLSRWDDVNAQLIIDSAFTHNCQLIVPFYLLAKQYTFGEIAERKSFLFSVPRTGQFNKVYIKNKGGSLSQSFDIPDLE